MEMESLRELYIDELKDLYSAEKQLVRALPKMAECATNPELRQAFEAHLAQTEGHVERLEKIFQTLEASPGGKKCKGMEGLIEEGEEMMREDAQDDVLDAGLISKAQHVEHYEIAGYGTVRTYALILGETAHADLLQQTLNEEKAADELLSTIAEGSVNIDAAIGDEAANSARRSVRDREVARVAQSDRATGEGKRERLRRPADEATRESRDR
jgi:ferritin-like metal-binding protein YciE